MNIEALNKFISFLTEVRDFATEKQKLEEQIKLQTKDIEEYKMELKAQAEKIEALEEEMSDMTEVESIDLAGGVLEVNLDDLDYMTRESFKAWVNQHAITNSEPLFNI